MDSKDYRERAVKALFDSGRMLLGPERKLKSGRYSRYFVNMGEGSDGSLDDVGWLYAAAIMDKVGADKFDVIFAPAEKAPPLGAVTVAALKREHDVNKGFVYDRKGAKMYGEATDRSEDVREQRQKEMLIGARLKAGDRVLGLDDVMTDGKTKYDGDALLDTMADVKHAGWVIFVDRQEIDSSGESALAQYEKAKGAPVVSVLKFIDLYREWERTSALNPELDAQLRRYARAYGTRELRQAMGLDKADEPFMPVARSIIPAMDIDPADPNVMQKVETIIKETAGCEKVGGYKFGAALAVPFGLQRFSEMVRTHAKGKKVIYDHQKAGTDIPDFGPMYARAVRVGGADAAIFFPQAGPRTATEFIAACMNEGMFPIVGGEMTHDDYICDPEHNQHGYIRADAPDEIYSRAANRGVSHFVVPGNKPDRVKHFNEVIVAAGVPVSDKFAPGFITQGGDISETGNVAGERFHAIVGRAIMEAKDIQKAVYTLTRQI